MGASLPPAELLYSGWYPYIVDFLQKAVRTLMPGQAVTSWYRTPEHNADVGGDPESQHLLGLAWDVAGPGADTTIFLARRAGLIAVNEGSHVHLQSFGPGVLSRAGVVFPRPATSTVQVSVADRGSD